MGKNNHQRDLLLKNLTKILSALDPRDVIPHLRTLLDDGKSSSSQYSFFHGTVATIGHAHFIMLICQDKFLICQIEIGFERLLLGISDLQNGASRHFVYTDFSPSGLKICPERLKNKIGLFCPNCWIMALSPLQIHPHSSGLETSPAWPCKQSLGDKAIMIMIDKSLWAQY